MTLFECRIPYTTISTRVLRMRTRAALLFAIQMYKDGHTNPITTRSSRYFSRHTRRQTSDARTELLSLELVTDRLEFIEPTEYERLCIPSTLNLNKFSISEIKTLITCYDVVRGKHDAFSFTMSRAELGHRVGISDKSLRDALTQLAERHLVQTKTVVTAPGTKDAKYGIKVTLMDPRPEWAGWDLKSVGLYYRRKEDGIPAHSRYDAILNKPAYSPRGQANWFPHLPEDGFKTLCPFCKDKQMGPIRKRRATPQATLIVSSLTQDTWGCTRCGRRGDSKYLYARMGKFLDSDGPPRLSAKMDKLPDTAPDDWEPEPEPMDETIDQIWKAT